ncbi:GNAT family N-acetyltransferase [Desmospora profundinema]|uniref:RimJ/RimL family protein N-acetyltransferase n=1 Tax=Desmospora profundinema TaxID=1571184 RepID=A0ABU1IQF5_9BACL|nr:GNAT family protein [Desmospora profundinema]MDR6226154.1 RimJ/RimL family protein N-acetyltransferase [Desmospora profundinema]
MIRLEPLAPADWKRLVEWTDSPEFLLQWAGPQFRFPLDEEQIKAHVEEGAGIRRNFKAVLQDSGEMAGHVELNHINLENRSATVSRVLLDPHRRGGGLGAAMVEEAVRIGFEGLGLHRLDLYVFDFNRSAIACYEKVGFRREGVLRHARRMGDEYWNLCVMGLLEDEWRGL